MTDLLTKGLTRACTNDPSGKYNFIMLETLQPWFFHYILWTFSQLTLSYGNACILANVLETFLFWLFSAIPIPI